MTLGVELLASYWTISAGLPHTDREYSPFDFKDRVKSAARAGFKGFGIWHADLEHVLEKYRLQEMKQILDDNGIQHVELEFLTDWFLEGERKKLSDIRKRKLFDAAEGLGAHQHQRHANRVHGRQLCGEAAELSGRVHRRTRRQWNGQRSCGFGS